MNTSDPTHNRGKVKIINSFATTQEQMETTAKPSKGRLATEKPNSPTRLLAATIMYKIMKRFGEGMTQHEIQEEYQVRPKQLALCLTGWKYLGGTDRKVLAKKHKAPDDDSKPSTSTGNQ